MLRILGLTALAVGVVGGVLFVRSRKNAAEPINERL